ncbi:MAG: GspH/FimT family pseudopilin [Pseudomonadota bacterium]|nr:GspH/FimT family pseudopilin [Pseudomonadota bacterium]
MKKLNNSYGFMLLELNIIFMLMSILILCVFSTKISSYFKIISYKNIALETINLTRLEASISKNKLSICPSADEQSCANSWSQKHLLVKSGDKVLHKRSIPNTINVFWRASLKNSRKIIFKSDGTSGNGEQGTLTIGCLFELPCYKIILNHSGNVSLN